MSAFTRSPHRWPIVLVLLAASLLSGAGGARAQPGAGFAAGPPPELPGAALVAPDAGFTYPFPITTASSVKRNLRAAYNAQHNEYLVVWQNEYPGSNPYTPTHLAGQRVAPGGATIGPSFIIAIDEARDNRDLAIAYDPVHDQYLVVWAFDIQGDGADLDIAGRLIPWDGPTNAFPAFTISNSRYNEQNPRVAYGLFASEFVVVWTSMSTDPGQQPWITQRRVWYDGSTPWPSGTVISTSDHLRRNVDITYNPNPLYNEFLVTYEERVNDVQTRIRGLRLNPDTSWKVADELTVADANALQLRPVAATCLEGYAVVYQWNTSPPNFGVYVQLLDSAGARVGLPLRVADTTADESGARVVCGGSYDRYLFAWSNMYNNGIYGVNMRAMSPGGALGPIIPVAYPYGTYNRQRPALASGTLLTASYGYLVAWEQDRVPASPYNDVYGRGVLSVSVPVPAVRK